MKYPNYLTMRKDEYEELFRLSREYYDKVIRSMMRTDYFDDKAVPVDYTLFEEMKRIIINVFDIRGELKTLQFAYCYGKMNDIEHAWKMFSIIKRKYTEGNFMKITHRFNYVLGNHP